MRIDEETRALALEYVGRKSSSDQEILAELISIISRPEQISNTNRFASLLVEITDDRFIPMLIEKVVDGTRGEDFWLSDYMYALGMLLYDRDECYPVDDVFVRLMGDWLLNGKGGEISWKAGGILSEVEAPAAREYLLKGAADTSLFHLTRISCVRGVVNNFRDDAWALLESLDGDEDDYVREACRSASSFLKEHRKK
ncbi:hypothetical protein OKA04_21585 [Luteolibacter flavescens]|uniref:HEAT repeat domain-containing protein n=1 Tax=Luteolibacter flavescens TaxID=1859460 RepID=A0ABT3FVU8_9BACT|nr:hypothetical protein [Luteolibacter flavescens]MCW1887344.1 hypothetical protein [Luteolibacter flavescens]